MFTKQCSGKRPKICVFMSNKGLKGLDGPLRLPQGGETCGLKQPFKGLTAFKFCKSWRFFDCYFEVKKRVLSSNGAPAGLQRARRHVATGPPLQGNSSPVAGPGGPRGAPPRPSTRRRRADATHKQLRMRVLQKCQFFRQKTAPILTFVRFENLGTRRKYFQKWA